MCTVVLLHSSRQIQSNMTLEATMHYSHYSAYSSLLNKYISKNKDILKPVGLFYTINNKEHNG